MNFEFLMPTKLIFGDGSLGKTSEYIVGNRVLIICDPIIEKIGILEKLRKYLTGKEVVVYSGVTANPDFDTVDGAIRLATENKVETVIGLGGGSSMDTAKAVACITPNKGILSDYLYNKKAVQKKRLPLVLIPTTSGTGSECTSVGVFSDHENNKKLPFFSAEMRADAAVIDPVLTHTAPSKVTAVTGIDAFTHAIESYWNITYSPITDMIAMSACDLVLKNLPVCYKEPENSIARSNMALASMMGGFAFGQTKTTVIHSLSFPLADLYKIDHGIACALSLVAFIKYVYPSAKEKMDKLINYCGYSSITEFADTISQMISDMKIPQKLSEVGAVKGDIEYLVKETMKFGMTNLLPEKITEKEMTGILEGLIN